MGTNNLGQVVRTKNYESYDKACFTFCDFSGGLGTVGGVTTDFDGNALGASSISAALAAATALPGLRLINPTTLLGYTSGAYIGVTKINFLCGSSYWRFFWGTVQAMNEVNYNLAFVMGSGTGAMMSTLDFTWMAHGCLTPKQTQTLSWATTPKTVNTLTDPICLWATPQAYSTSVGFSFQIEIRKFGFKAYPYGATSY